jgi:hypothetical protein
VEWIELGNGHQKAWALRYLEKFRKDIVSLGVMSVDDRLKEALNGLIRNDSNELFLIRMKASWAQEKYRSNLKKKGLVTTSRVISSESKRKLKQLADSEGVSFNSVTEGLIRHGFSVERVETEKHQKEKEKLRTKLKNAKLEIESLDAELRKYVGNDVRILHKMMVNNLQGKVLELESENLALSEEVKCLKAKLAEADLGGDSQATVTEESKVGAAASLEQDSYIPIQQQELKLED